MRRISLAMALLGAVAATGCGGGSNPSSSGSSKGVPGSTFTVLVRGEVAYFDATTSTTVMLPGGGLITGTGISCGISGGSVALDCTEDFPWGTPSAPTMVTLTAAPDASNGYGYYAFAGACTGSVPCIVTGNADKFVLVRFATTQAGLGAHPNLSAAAAHSPMYMSFLRGEPGALQCTTCHGANLQGQGLAPSCSSSACHTLPTTAAGAHFDAALAPWTDHGTGWSRSCLRCHTSEGYRDYVGVDGSAEYLGTTFQTTQTLTSTTVACETAGTCNPAAYPYGPLKCWTCHNPVTSPAAAGITTINFVSLKTVTTNEQTALCGQCHQGRESTKSVNDKIAGIDPDTQITTAAAGTSFINPHYLGAAGTMFGADAQMWAEYPGKIYTRANKHAVNEGKCTSCHDAHTLDVNVTAETCGRCHFDELSGAPVANFLQLEESRQFGFEGDIDGDTVQESLKLEIEGLADTLYATMRQYATDVVGTSLVYDGNAYPYFFVDANGDGIHDATETTQFKKFTPRLMRAAFNYKWSHAEPGAWAHNPRYAIEILFDAIADLKAGLGTPLTIANVTDRFRSFNGHFGGARAAAPYRPFVYSAFPATSGFSSAACYQCHGGQGGYEQYLSNPLGSALTTANKVTGLQCTTCHAPAAGDTDFKRIRSDVAAVYFPPQKDNTATPSPSQVSIAATALPDKFPVCATCHTGRENGKSVDNSIANNYALSATGLTVTAVDPSGVASVTVASSGWSANRYQAARLSFTSGANAGTSVIVKASTATAGGVSNISFNTALANAAVPGDTFDLTFDDATWGIGFTNPHYLGAAGVLVGSNGHMLYEYAGQTYAGYPVNWNVASNGNAPGPYGSPHGGACVGCHRPKPSKHTFEIDFSYCQGCHTVGGPYDLGPKALEVEEAAVELYAAIQAYASAAGQTICYNGASHPYWFADDDSDGTCSTSVQAKLDAKVAKAAYNFKWAHAEPGAYAHNLEYMMQALYDSIVDMGGTPSFTRP